MSTTVGSLEPADGAEEAEEEEAEEEALESALLLLLELLELLELLHSAEAGAAAEDSILELLRGARSKPRRNFLRLQLTRMSSKSSRPLQCATTHSRPLPLQPAMPLATAFTWRQSDEELFLDIALKNSAFSINDVECA